VKEGLVILTEDTAPSHPLLYGPKGWACSRNLDPNFCPGQGLNLGPLTWQSSMQSNAHPQLWKCTVWRDDWQVRVDRGSVKISGPTGRNRTAGSL